MKNFLTENYDIEYNDLTYETNTTIEVELYRAALYKKFLDEFKSLCLKNDIILNKKDAEKNIFATNELLFLLIVSSKNSDDIIFSKNFNYDDILIQKYLNDKNNKKVLSELKTELKQLSKKYFTSLKKFSDANTEFYNVIKENGDNVIILNLEKNDKNNDEQTKKLDSYISKITISTTLYNHISKVYMLKNNDDETKKDYFIYILFYRYTNLFSGSTQASILPSFKMMLKKLLNIKIELFGSAINTSSTNYGSLCYDIEKRFGSMGSFYDMTIKAGYFEANPPFEFKAIDEMFNKMLYSLENAKKGLLFFVIIPTIKNHGFKSYDILKNKKYIKLEMFVKKEYFPYLYYNLTFTKTILRPIIDTSLIILHNDYIKPVIKSIVSNFDVHVNKWFNNNKHKNSS